MDRTTFWAVCGFKLPQGLARCPSRLIEAQSQSLGEQSTLCPIDPFAVPVELVWDRCVTNRPAADMKDLIEPALFRIYSGYGYFWSLWEPLRQFHLQLNGNGTPALLPAGVSDMRRRSLTGGAVVHALSAIERCVDLSEQTARVYLGETRRTSQKIPPIHKLQEKVQRLAETTEIETCLRRAGATGPIARDAVVSAARAIASPPWEISAKVHDAKPISAEIAMPLRHTWGHGLDQDFGFVSHNTLAVYADVLNAVFDRMLWLLYGTSTGAALGPWYTLARGPAMPRKSPAGDT